MKTTAQHVEIDVMLHRYKLNDEGRRQIAAFVKEHYDVDDPEFERTEETLNETISEKITDAEEWLNEYSSLDGYDLSLEDTETKSRYYECASITPDGTNRILDTYKIFAEEHHTESDYVVLRLNDRGRILVREIVNKELASEYEKYQNYRRDWMSKYTNIDVYIRESEQNVAECKEAEFSVNGKIFLLDQDKHFDRMLHRDFDFI